MIYPSQSTAGPFTLSAVPVGGGSAITASCAAPDCTLSGLQPGTTYAVTATATTSSGTRTSASTATTVTTASAGSPVVVLQATSPTSVAVRVSPSPGTGGPYTVTAVPVGGGSPVTVACPTTACSLAGLAAGTTYGVTVTGRDGNGKATAPSAGDSVTTPKRG